jgi:uncharacterized membrane protein YheB (UPF0754 family)
LYIQKLTAINIILSDETIHEIIENEFPEVLDNIKKNSELKGKINAALIEYMNKTLKKPLHEYIENIGFDKFYEYRAKVNHRLKAYIHSENFNIKISQIINKNLQDLGDKKFEELFDILNKNDADLIGKSYQMSIDVLTFMNNEEGKKNIELLFYNILSSVNVNNMYSNITEQTFDKIVINIKEAINSIIDKNIIDAFDAIDIAKIITNKINSLPLAGVENLLFSFMKDEFAWINILGFILGFIIGLIEVILLIW